MSFRTLAICALLAGATPAGAHAQSRIEAGAALGASFVARVFDMPKVGDDFLITGADDDGLNLSLYIERSIHIPHVRVRAEAMYNALRSPPNLYARAADRSGLLRMALRDDVLALLGAVIVQAAPHRRLTPHVILGGGVFHTRLGTNPDPDARAVTVTHAGFGIGVNGGVGMQWQRNAWRVRIETRWHEVIASHRGSGFVPLTVGIARTIGGAQ